MDDLGFMQITDRAKDVIKSGGEWISSIELENAAVSFGGMLCISPLPILPGTKVEVALDVEAPKQRGLRVSARVVRLERETEDSSFAVALAFDLDTQEERRDLVRLVEQNGQAPA